MRPLPVAAVLIFVFASAGHAQTQIGGHYAFAALEYPDQTRHGVGAFLVYSPVEWIGIDLATSVLPSDDIGEGAWQLSVGPRVGGSIGGFGIFGRVRPGLIRFSERFFAPEIVCIAIFPPPEGCLAKSSNFVLDYGATIEGSPSPRTVIRVDIGDAVIRYRRGVDGASWQHSLQLTAGLGVRF